MPSNLKKSIHRALGYKPRASGAAARRWPSEGARGGTQAPRPSESGGQRACVDAFIRQSGRTAKLAAVDVEARAPCCWPSAAWGL
jgi:hypothetical protein